MSRSRRCHGCRKPGTNKARQSPGPGSPRSLLSYHINMNFTSIALAFCSLLISSVYAVQILVPSAGASYQVGATLVVTGTSTFNTNLGNQITVYINSGTYTDSVILYNIPISGSWTTSFVLPLTVTGSFVAYAIPSGAGDTLNASVTFTVTPYPTTTVTIPACSPCGPCASPCSPCGPCAPVYRPPVCNPCGLRYCNEQEPENVAPFQAPI